MTFSEFSEFDFQVCQLEPTIVIFKISWIVLGTPPTFAEESVRVSYPPTPTVCFSNSSTASINCPPCSEVATTKLSALAFSSPLSV